MNHHFENIKNTQNPYDMVSITPDYERPAFKFPDINGHLGNPREFFQLACECLREHGFKKESYELDHLYKNSSYHEHFNNIARFLDFSHKDEILQEDDQYVYLRIRKNQVDVKQINWFKYIALGNIASLLEDKVDFSQENVYGRTVFHYAQGDVLQKLLEYNKTERWIDGLHFDNFGSQLLHMQPNIKSFNMVLEYLITDYSDTVSTAIHIANDFGVTPFHHANALLGQLKLEIQSDFEDFGKYLNLISIIDKKLPEPGDYVAGYINIFDKTPYYKKLLPIEKKEKIAELFGYIHPEKPDTSPQPSKALKI